MTHSNRLFLRYYYIAMLSKISPPAASIWLMRWCAQDHLCIAPYGGKCEISGAFYLKYPPFYLLKICKRHGESYGGPFCVSLLPISRLPILIPYFPTAQRNKYDKSSMSFPFSRIKFLNTACGRLGFFVYISPSVFTKCELSAPSISN